MSKLSQIESFIKPCADVISSIIQADVTVVDENLNRVYGTNSYRTFPIVAQKKSSAFFNEILVSGHAKLVTDIHNDNVCKKCGHKDICIVNAEMGYPLQDQGEIIGIIGIAAFEPKAGKFIRENYEKLTEFLKYISILICSQLKTEEQTVMLKKQLGEVSRQNARYNIIGESRKVLEVLTFARKISTSDSTVLITGESGTGKEELAKFLHANSKRCEGPMITVNCGAIPDNLIESELFGYEGGSFTGARKGGAPGKFELANHGTLFLDEIGELPLLAQTKLLRALQEKAIERIGGKKTIPVDIRIVAATNRSLKEMVENHAFREDLYYRLNVIPMEMPPLRDRGNDILLLAQHFLMEYNRMLHKNIQGFDYNAQMLLQTYSWPGNIRELRNMIEFLVNIVEGNLITAQDLPAHISNSTRPEFGTKMTLSELMQNYEKSILQAYLKDAVTKEDKLKAAKELGISQATLYRKLSQYQL